MTDTAEGAAEQLGTRVVSNSLFILAARTVSRVVSLVVVIALANSLGDSNYGRYTTLVAYSGLVAVLADLGFAPLYTREAARSPRELGDYLGTLIVFRVALAAVAAVVFALALGLGAGLWSLVVPGCALLITGAYANLLRNTFYSVGRAEFDAGAIVAEVLIQGVLIFLGARRHADVGYFVWAYSASYLFTIVYSLVVIRVFGLGNVRLGLNMALVRRWLPLALPFAITFFLTNLYFRAGVLILQQFRSFAEVGWYTFAYKPFEALQFVPLAIQAVVYPLLGVYFVSDPSRLKAAYERFYRVLILLGWPLTVGTFVLVHPINQLFNRSGAFAQSEDALRILAFGLYGFLGASTATVVTEAALCTFGWWFVQRHRADLRLPVFGLVWRTLVAGLVMGVILYPLSRFSIFLAAPAGFAAYALAIYLLRAVSPEEWRLATAIVRRRNPARVPAVGGGGKA
ncbi:MAG: hypothetical protein AUI15_14145 [Actinobacteria bacterium 13_2_20CM_2_66_6]|nr:MAG: hypothetical protein AUI15_14145 [Actinobacteria bacterium 13_2_20CM_2_66_6]